jgi:transketolase
MGLPTIYVFTHDSIFVGEDGPTHQPVEQLATLRAIPGLTVFRPADANETTAAWKAALENREGPVALLLTRQNLPILENADAEGVTRGGYVLSDAADAQALLIATGSEVDLALQAQKLLAQEGIATRVVSMPSWERFEQQSEAYRQEVLPPQITARVAIEAALPMGWERYVGPRGEVIGMTRFGASAPYKVLAEKFGFTAQEVAARVRACLA